MLSTNFKRYLIVGTLAYAVEMIILYGLRYALNLSPLKAVAISFWTGLVVAFILQKIITFKNHSRSLHILSKQLGGYGVLVAFNYAFTLLLVNLFSPSFSVFLIRTMAILITTLWNYIIYRSLFKNQEAS